LAVVRRISTTLAAALAVALTATGVASGHTGNPNFRSVIRSFTPTTSGLTFQVLYYDDQIEVRNFSHKTVTIYGYNSDPYLRLLPNGTVERNRLSPATYLNEERDLSGNITVPAFAKASAAPQWRVLSKTSTITFHDHRMHWMGQQLPPQVKDKSKQYKIDDYKIPIDVNGVHGVVNGTLFWNGEQTGFPIAAAISIGLIALAGGGFVFYIRRRRAGAAPEGSATPVKEAW
jgi:hypothetical protein